MIGGFRFVWFVSVLQTKALKIFLIFLILATSKNGAMSASVPQKSSTHHRDSFDILSYDFVGQAWRKRSNIVICINPAPTEIIDGKEKPKVPSNFTKRAKR